MKMTRRSFFLHPGRPISDNLENVGEWLQRTCTRDGVPHKVGSPETPNEQMVPPLAPTLGLRNARATLRRD